MYMYIKQKDTSPLQGFITGTHPLWTKKPSHTDYT